MSDFPLHEQQWKLQRSIDVKTRSMALDLRSNPQGCFEHLNIGLTDESAPDAHVPLPDASFWEERKEEYHKVYMAEVGRRMGMNLNRNIYLLEMEGLSRGDRKRITTAHHDKMQLAVKRIRAALEHFPVRLLSDGHRFRRHPMADSWEKVSCFIGADEYMFFKLPNALQELTAPFWGFYIICHADVERMDGHHVLMTGMENRLRRLGLPHLLYGVAAFRVDLDLAELLLQRINTLEVKNKVPLGQARQMEFEMKLSDMVGELQELLEAWNREEAAKQVRDYAVCAKVDRAALSMSSFVKELNQALNALKRAP